MTSEQKPWNELLKSISLSQFIPKNPPPILEIDEEMNAFEAAEVRIFDLPRSPPGRFIPPVDSCGSQLSQRSCQNSRCLLFSALHREVQGNIVPTRPSELLRQVLPGNEYENPLRSLIESTRVVCRERGDRQRGGRRRRDQPLSHRRLLQPVFHSRSLSHCSSLTEIDKMKTYKIKDILGMSSRGPAIP